MNESSPLRVIVTGGSGFLGQHLIKALKDAGHQVKNVDIVDSNVCETVIADVRDAELMKQVIKDADVVFHLASLIQAGESVTLPQKYVDYNISGTVSVLEAMRENQIKTFIFSSSAAIYGEPKRSPIMEDDVTLPINPYGMTKLAMEGLVSSYVAAHQFNGVALRYFNLYGPGENHIPETHAIPRFIDQIYHDKEVTVWGNGEHLRDYIYIADVVAAHLKAITLTQQQPAKYHYFNLCTQKPTSVMEIIKLLEGMIGKQALIKHHQSRAGDPLVLTADTSKAKAQLDWQANVSLEQGLKNTLEYFINLWEKHG